MSRFKPPSLSPAELKQSLQDEFRFLMRQEKAMANDTVVYKQETKSLLCKQEQTIQQLEKEKSDMELTMKTLKTQANSRRDMQENEDIRCLLHLVEEYKSRIADEHLELFSLDTFLNQSQKQVDTFLKEKSGMKGLIEELPRLLRTNKKLEERLYMATVKFNKMVNDNKVLRKATYDLLKEREMFKKVNDELINSIERAKMTINVYVEHIKLNFSLVGENYARNRTLQSRNKNDYRNNSDEMKRLNRLFENSKGLAEFMEVMSKKRGLLARQLELASKQEQATMDMKERLQKYRDILEVLRDIKQEDNVDIIMVRYAKRNYLNFSFFNYTNILESEIKYCEEQILYLREDIDNEISTIKYRGENQDIKLNRLQADIITRLTESLAVEAKVEDIQQMTDHLLQGIEELFIILHCDDMPLAIILGEKKHVNIYNYKLFFDIIERRILQLLAIVLFPLSQGKLGEIKKLEKTEGVIVEKVPSATSTIDGCELPRTREEIRRELDIKEVFDAVEFQ